MSVEHPEPLSLRDLRDVLVALYGATLIEAIDNAFASFTDEDEDVEDNGPC